MKRLVVIAAIVLSAANIFASELVIKGNVDVPFSVFINGEKYYSYNNKVTITNLSSGRYGMEIYTEGYANELLYDYSIDVPWRSTVYATFTGDNKMYISTSNNTPKVVVHLNPYPRRVVVPVCHYSKPAPRPHYNAAPAPRPHNSYHAPVPKPQHHVAPAPKHNNKPSAPNRSVERPHNEKSSSAAVRPSTAPTSKANTSRSTASTRR